MAEPLETIAEVKSLTAKEMGERRPVESKGLVVAIALKRQLLKL